MRLAYGVNLLIHSLAPVEDIENSFTVKYYFPLPFGDLT